MKNNRQTILGALAGIVVFLITAFWFEFSFPISIILTVGTYFGVYFLTKPTYKFGDVDIDSLANSEEIKELLNAANKDLKIIESASLKAKHQEIRQNARKLYKTGVSIIDYLKKNPKKILTARRFLSYYLDTAADIVEKYFEFTATKFESEEMDKIYSETNRALIILNDAFEKQFVKLMESEFFDIEAEISVLEKTLKLEE